ncbi:MAG: ATP-binding protein [Chloroflexota bacterium]
MKQQILPLEGLDESIFVDREDDLEYLWKWANNKPQPVSRSIALIGRRRTGKTAILLKLFNRLFFKQTDVMPVFISFARHLKRRKQLTVYDFVKEYMQSYVRCYLAFQHRDPALLEDDVRLEELRQYAEEKQDIVILKLLERYDLAMSAATTYDAINFVINMPRGQAWRTEIQTVVIVDEFQALTNVYDSEQDIYYDLTDGFQQAAESRVAPMLVSGSAVTMLIDQALGGMLSGRFKYRDMRPLPKEDSHDLVFRLSDYMQHKDKGAHVDEEFAEAVWKITGGYPFSIHSLMDSSSPDCVGYPNLDALKKVIIYELTDFRGSLFQHYYEEFGKFIHELNEGDTTRQVMLWVAKHADELLMAKNIAKSLGIDRKEVANALEKLRWVDVIKRQGLISFYGPTDPMLCRYIEYQHSLEFDDFTPETVLKNWEDEYKQIRGDLNQALGEIGELYARMVMRGFEGQTIDGSDYFTLSGDVTLPKFMRIERRGGLVVEGESVEIDVTGEWLINRDLDHLTKGAWLVEAKYTQEPITKPVVAHFLKQSKHVEERFGYQQVVRWFFSRSGFTGPAETLMKQEGVLHSDWKQFLALARTMGFFGLPSRKT